MKSAFKFLISGIIGFAAGYIVLELFMGRTTGEMLNTVYFWLSNVLVITAICLIIFSFIKKKKLMSMHNDKNRSMDEDNYDIYRYNAVNDILSATNAAMILSMISLAVQAVTPSVLWIIILTVLLVLVTTSMNMKSAGLMSILYPERNFPKPSDKDYNKKLFEASDEGEIIIMANGLYKSYTLMTILLFSSLVVLIFYSIITGESQIFSIILIGFTLIISQLKYAGEIREK